MPKSKSRKDHKSKVATRNAAVKNSANKAQKAQKEFIMNLIKQEQEKGAFDNVQAGPLMGGPLMGGPLMGGPLSFDGDLLTFDGPTLGAPVVDIIDIPVVDETIQSEKTEEKIEGDGSSL
jgi:hypothetical protein